MKVTRNNSTYLGTSGSGQPSYIAEASTLGLKPGVWPGQIDSDLQNGQPFLRKRWSRTVDGEIIDVTYWQAFGTAVLTVIND